MDLVTSIKPKSVNKQATEVLDFLNEKTGRNYRPTNVNITFIKARLAEGYTIEEMRAVVAMKCREWPKGHDMNKYLRPATLFNNKLFNQYAGELDYGD